MHKKKFGEGYEDDFNTKRCNTFNISWGKHPKIKVKSLTKVTISITNSVLNFSKRGSNNK